MRTFAGRSRKPPELMDPERERDRRRIMALFTPYRVRLAAVIGADRVLRSGSSMISPFLLRAVLDTALPQHDGTLLTELVLGMIAIAIATAALSVWQTYISNVIGQRVMHDLRAAVYRHLQRMSLAFFTRTRDGRGAVADRQRHRRHRQRRHDDGDVDRPERHDGDRDDRRDGRCSTGGWR